MPVELGDRRAATRRIPSAHAGTDVTTALLFGALASSAFIVGVVIGLFTRPPQKVVAGLLAFGGGILVSALTFDLMEEAFETGSTAAVLAGFMLGAVIYVAITVVLDRMAAVSPKREGRRGEDVVPDAHRKRETTEQATISGTAILIGTVLDGIPENAAIGISLQAPGEGHSLGIVLLAAVFLSNLPNTISSTVGMRQEGRSPRYIFAVWTIVAIACTGSAVLGYVLLSGLPGDVVAAMLGLAAGSILALLADTVFPEAFENGGPFVALVTAFGFACALLLAQVTG
jgi:ZIP family zinc transporter